jgi:hypothetical protein
VTYQLALAVPYREFWLGGAGGLDLPGGGGGAPRGIVVFLPGKAGPGREVGGGFGDDVLGMGGGREMFPGGGFERVGGGGGLLRLPGPNPEEGVPPRAGGEGSCRPPELELLPEVERVLPADMERGKLSDPDE